MSSGIRKLVLSFSIIFACSASSAGVMSTEKQEVIPLPETAPVTLTYRAVNSLNLVYPGSVASQVAQRAQDATGMPSRSLTRPDGTTLVYGLRTSYVPEKHELAVSYEAHEIGKQGVVLGQTISMVIHMDEGAEGDRRTVTVTFPSEASSASKKLFLFAAPQLKTDLVLADYALLVAAIKQAEVNVQNRLTGEIESKYRPDAVLANFDRLIGRERVNGNAVRTETSLADRFLYRGNDFNTIIAVTAFAYRDGSKVQYSVNVPLKLEPDGSARGDERAKAIQDLVTKVVND